MTNADVAEAQDVLGITTVIDLRDPKVVAQDGTGPLIKPPIAYHNIPIVQDVDRAIEQAWSYSNAGEGYVRRLRGPDYGKRIADVLALITDPDAGPSVFHCTLGKDRTGLMAAVILGTLGVVDVEIVEDYALTGKYMDRIIGRAVADPVRAESLQRVPPYLLEARAESMELVLTTVQSEFGSMRGYVEAQGVDEMVLRRLEDMLLV